MINGKLNNHKREDPEGGGIGTIMWILNKFFESLICRNKDMQKKFCQIPIPQNDFAEIWLDFARYFVLQKFIV